MIIRNIQDIVIQDSKTNPVIAITGPRQSGKTILSKMSFPNYHYVNLEDIELRNYAIDDPKSFINQYENGVIIDEIQYAPDLFSYIQVKVDESGQMGKFILTGSQNFLLHEKISQSLSGRVVLHTLLPFSYNELDEKDLETEAYIFKGFYPRIYNEKPDVVRWYQSYISTYLERDVRLIKNIGDLKNFHTFLKLCAGRIGQIVNYNEMSTILGISVNTVKSWFSVLESSYIIYLLQPYYNNFNKRLIKSPKLYFTDIGLASVLLNLNKQEEVLQHFSRGALFENLVVSEVMKHFCNKGIKKDIYYWRESNGVELDLLFENHGVLNVMEVKAAKTIHSDFLKNINLFKQYSRSVKTKSGLVYDGLENQQRNEFQILNWRKLSEFI